MRLPPVSLSFILQGHSRTQVQGPLRKNIKCFSTKFTKREFEEIQISVPWGHLAGKWYGPRDKRPIVGLHGWQDNAGTFDNLAPLLPSHLSFLSLDLPGHGLSSWLPEGCSYHSSDHINIYLSLMREFNWDKISLISHSMSAVDGLMFNSLFPDKCDMFVAVDLLQPFLGKDKISLQMLTNQIVEYNKQIEMSRQVTKPPSYKMDELIERMQKVIGDSILDECYDMILKRNIKLSDDEKDKYCFSRDGRLKSMAFTIFPHDIIMEMVKKIKCPHLFIKAKIGTHYISEEEMEKVYNTLKTNPDFQFHLVDGTHYVHLNEPQKIADIVNPFIEKYRPE